MLTTTLNKILAHNPCGQKTCGKTGYSKLLASLGKTEADDEPLPLTVILDSNGFYDALWCVRTIDSAERKYSARLALSFAEDVRHLMSDPRSIAALDVTRRYLEGDATRQELNKVHTAAAYAAYAADAAYAAYAAAAYAAYAAYAADAAYAAYTAYAAAYAADAAYAAYAAAAAAVREKQKARLRRFFETWEITP